MEMDAQKPTQSDDPEIEPRAGTADNVSHKEYCAGRDTNLPATITCWLFVMVETHALRMYKVHTGVI